MRSRVLPTVFLALQGLSLSAFAQSTVFAPQEFEFCGYNAMPATPEYVVEYNRVERQRIVLGYTRVCDRILQSSDLQKAIRPWQETLPLLGFIPVDLKSTPFAAFELMGGVLGDKIPPFAALTRTDHVARVFRRDDGFIVTLEEWDLTIQGVGTSEVYRGPDVRVTGWPGYWSIIQGKSGKAYSTLWWQGETRQFYLTINTNLKIAGRQNEILRLAESLPPGKPSGNKKPRIAVLGHPGVLSKVPFPELPPENIE